MTSVFEDCIRYALGLAQSALDGEDVHVSIGGSNKELPNEFIVRELAQSVSWSDRVTNTYAMGKASGAYRVEFNVGCECWAKRRSVVDASMTVQSWVMAFAERVMHDKTLGGLCVHAQPYMENGGTAVDAGGRACIADFTFGVHIKADIDPAKTYQD